MDIGRTRPRLEIWKREFERWPRLETLRYQSDPATPIKSLSGRIVGGVGRPIKQSKSASGLIL